MFDKIHHGVELLRSAHENLYGLFNVMGAIKNGLFDLCVRQLAVKVKGYFRFPNIVTHETLK